MASTSVSLNIQVTNTVPHITTTTIIPNDQSQISVNPTTVPTCITPSSNTCPTFQAVFSIMDIDLGQIITTNCLLKNDQGTIIQTATTITGIGNKVLTFRAPQTPGIYDLACTVNDGIDSSITHTNVKVNWLPVITNPSSLDSVKAGKKLKFDFSVTDSDVSRKLQSINNICTVTCGQIDDPDNSLSRQKLTYTAPNIKPNPPLCKLSCTATDDMGDFDQFGSFPDYTLNIMIT